MVYGIACWFVLPVLLLSVLLLPLPLLPMFCSQWVFLLSSSHGWRGTPALHLPSVNPLVIPSLDFSSVSEYPACSGYAVCLSQPRPWFFLWILIQACWFCLTFCSLLLFLLCWVFFRTLSSVPASSFGCACIVTDYLCWTLLSVNKDFVWPDLLLRLSPILFQRHHLQQFSQILHFKLSLQQLNIFYNIMVYILCSSTGK